MKLTAEEYVILIKMFSRGKLWNDFLLLRTIHIHESVLLSRLGFKPFKTFFTKDLADYYALDLDGFMEAETIIEIRKARKNPAGNVLPGEKASKSK